MSSPQRRALKRGVCSLETRAGRATGFALLGPRWIATAGHVVASHEGSDPVFATFSGERGVARVAYRHPFLDLALLELAVVVAGVVPFLPGVEPLETGPLVCVSRLRRARGGTDPGALIESDVRSFERTRRSRDGHLEDILMLRTSALGPGDSGSPVLSSDGSVQGVVINSIAIGDDVFLRATCINPLLEAFSSIDAPGGRVFASISSEGRGQNAREPREENRA